VNATLPKGADPQGVTLEQAVELLAEKAAKGGKGKAGGRKAPAKKASAKKSPAKSSEKARKAAGG
jgi:DNA topoisomerase-1